MKIIIAGAGSVGVSLARQLIAENNDVTLIDPDPERARAASNSLDCLVMNAAANDLSTLREARADEADYLIAVTRSDEINMITCGLAAGVLKTPTTIARISNPDFADTGVLNKAVSGIDFVVNAEIETARSVVNTLEHGAVSDVIYFEKSRLQIRNIFVTDNSFFVNKEVRTLRPLLGGEFLVAGIVRDGRFLAPEGSTRILEDDNLYLLGEADTLDRIFERVGKTREEIRRIVVVGGGRTGQYIAAHLLKRRTGRLRLPSALLRRAPRGRREVKIVERDYQRCKELANLFPESVVVNADISDEAVFAEERLGRADLLIATTENQELNILTAAYAKKMGIRRGICLVHNANYANLASHLEIDVVINSKNSLVNPILRFIRKGRVKSLYSIADSDAEIVELVLRRSSPATGQRIRDIRFPENTIAIAVLRGSDFIVPTGDTELRENDRLILATHQASIQRLEEFAGR